MNVEISTNEPNWYQSVILFMKNKKDFTLTDWDFTLHGPKTEALARRCRYTYKMDTAEQTAKFSPKKPN
jgi:hypothetical protein